MNNEINLTGRELELAEKEATLDNLKKVFGENSNEVRSWLGEDLVQPEDNYDGSTQQAEDEIRNDFINNQRN